MILTDNALTVLERRYFRKNKEGKIIENWDDLIKRVSGNIAGDDKDKSERFYKLLDSGNFLPNSPTLMNAGNDLQQLSEIISINPKPINSSNE